MWTVFTIYVSEEQKSKYDAPNKLTLLHTIVEPHGTEPRIAAIILVDDKVKRVLECDLAAVLLAQQCTDDRARLLPQSVAGDVIGDGEEDEGVEDGRDGVGGLDGREEGVGGGGRGHHDGG